MNNNLATPPATDAPTPAPIPFEEHVDKALNTIYCDGIDHAAAMAELAISAGEIDEIPALIRSLKEGKE